MSIVLYVALTREETICGTDYLEVTLTQLKEHVAPGNGSMSSVNEVCQLRREDLIILILSDSEIP